MRVDESGKALRGSQSQLQTYINEHPNLLEKAIRVASKEPDLEIVWRSPLKAIGYAEYRDSAFLEQLGLSNLTASLKDFWPNRGPVWDALGVARNYRESVYLLVEAKSHIPELVSTCKAVSSKSLATIHNSLDAAQRELTPETSCSWFESPYYQYVNRLAHLSWLDRHVSTRLLSIYFIDDAYRSTNQQAWQTALSQLKHSLGLIQPVRHHIEIFLSALPYNLPVEPCLNSRT